MANGLNSGVKRELLAQGLLWTGAAFVLSHIPPRDSLLVLNYHRVGDAENDPFDPGVFSATADQFNDQISYLKSRLTLVSLQEALGFVDGTIKDKSPRCRALITFDDGYLDNYDIVYPILRSHGVQGVFFLVTGLVGSCVIPWWDHVAFLVKTAQRRRFSLRYPAGLTVDIDRNGLTQSLEAILNLYKRPDNHDSARFVQELAEAAKGEDPPGNLQRFLSWDQAREMQRGGMAFGSQTHSHPVLSQLEPDRQSEELIRSRSIVKEELGVEVDALAYPVGDRSSFTDQTKTVARDAGYRVAFSFYGGTNLRGMTSPYDVARVPIAGQSLRRFRVQTAVCKATAKFWP